MSRRFLLAVPVSLAVHVVAAGALLLLLSRDAAPPVLFIDMTDATLVELPQTPLPPRPAPPAPRARKPPLEVREAPSAPAPISAPPAAQPEPKPESVAAAPPAAWPEVIAPPALPPVAPEARVPQVPTAPAPLPDPTSTTGGSAPAPAGPPAGPVGGGTSAAATRAPGGGAAGTVGGRPDAVAASTGTTGGSVEGNYLGYLGLVRRRLHEMLEYPSAARRRNLAGTVHVEIVIRVDGSIGEVIVAQSSSHAILDQAAVDALRRLPKLPFPPGLEPRTLRARLPIVFQLQ